MNLQNFLKTFLGVLVYLFLFTSVCGAFYYPYLCDNEDCRNTFEGEFEKSSDKYLIYNSSIEEISNFNDYINSSLETYSRYYGGELITLKGFYNGGEVSDRRVTFGELISLGEFHIDSRIEKEKVDGNDVEKLVLGSRYNNGKEYLFSNFDETIKAFHRNMGDVNGSGMNRLSRINSSIRGYDRESASFTVKNICNDEFCSSSKTENVSYNSNNRYFLLKGDVRKTDSIKTLTIDKSKSVPSKTESKAMVESININFIFDDFVNPRGNTNRYRYEFFYRYSGDTDFVSLFPAEEIEISSNKVTSLGNALGEVNDNVDEIVKAEVLKGRMSISIKEGFYPQRTGKIYLFASIENLSSGEKIDKEQVNMMGIQIYPNDEIRLGYAKIIDTDMQNGAFKKINDGEGFNAFHTFQLEINLKDSAGNDHYDNIDGYEVSLPSNYNGPIQIASSNGQAFGRSLDGVKTIESTNAIRIKFMATEPGYLDFPGISIRAREKSNNRIYSQPAKYKTIPSLIHPSELVNAQGGYIKLHIASEDKSDFTIRCQNKAITLKAQCTSDNLSGCDNYTGIKTLFGRPFPNTANFTTERDNGKKGALYIIDKATNIRSYQYVMNHIDMQMPELSFYKGDSLLSGNEKAFKASDDFRLEFNDPNAPNGCRDKTGNVRLNYTINITSDGKTVFNQNKNVNTINGVVVELGEYLKTAGNKVITITIKDGAGNTLNKTYSFTIYPTDEEFAEKGKFSFTVSSTADKFANNSDFYTYTLNNIKDKYGNVIYLNKLNSINQDISNITGYKTIPLRISDPSSPQALEIYGLNGSNGSFKFNMKSYAPGEYTQRFKTVINGWNDDNSVDTSRIIEFYPHIINNNTFKIPVELDKIESYDITEDGEVLGIPQIGVEQEYRIILINTGALSGYSDGNVGINRDSVYDSTEGHVWQKQDSIRNVFGSNLASVLSFRGRLDAISNALTSPHIVIENMLITYTIGGQRVNYYLVNDDEGIVGCERTTLGVRILGETQSDGNISETSSEEENFSDLYTGEIRGIIRKNATLFKSNMASGQIINGVKYQNGDISISGDQDYETLIVENGNVIITGDLNRSGKKLGIIVLKNNYDVNNDYNKSGNIYVNNNVEYIDAIMYADGTLRSAKLDGSPYSDGELLTMMEIKGTLFTRNTIGGATQLSGEYILPGGNRTPDFDLAQIYDLNYVRKTISCGEDDYALLIRYNPAVQINPPLGFSKE